MSQDELYLYAVTARVVDEFTSAAMLFTALDVSNAVKQTVPEARHREISPIVRDIFERRGMGAYIQSSIKVVAQGNKPTTAKELGISLKTLYNKLNRWEEEKRQAAG